MTTCLDIDLRQQTLALRSGDQVLNRYAISTAANGPGEVVGSGCTPRGLHYVRARIGAGAPSGAVFRGRRPTGEIWTPELHAQYPQRDWILTRILWLSGLEPGRNRLGCVDTFRRYIYIHGTPCVTELGQPVSHGCIRMSNDDIIDLFEHVDAGTQVLIHDQADDRSRHPINDPEWVAH
jgi:lipoprotein-anchoring transpeptidase ErfK/SrfK